MSTLATQEAAPRHSKLAEFARRHGYHPATITRFILKGKRLRDGSVAKLAAAYHPGGWRVAEEDFAEFVAKLTADRLGESAPPPAQIVKSREKRLARVDAELLAAGI